MTTWKRPDGKKTKLCPVCEEKYILYDDDCCAECGRPRKNPAIDWKRFLVSREKINYENEHGYLVLDDEQRFVGVAVCESEENAFDGGMTFVRFFDWFESDFGKWGQLFYEYGGRHSFGYVSRYSFGLGFYEKHDPILIGHYVPVPYKKLERSMPQRTVGFLPWSVSELGYMQIVQCKNA